MSKYHIRVNGVGNAWPVYLGSEHPFYDPEDPEQLASVSFSIIKSRGDSFDERGIEWELLIDAGHGIIQYLIRHGNRLPDAVVLTHAHMDHNSSLDWILQSYYRHHKKESTMPVYASNSAWSDLSGSLPQLPGLSSFGELLPGAEAGFDGIPEVKLTAFPVYHGEKARGPNMLAFQIILPGGEVRKIIFSGDVLCPLLRKADYRFLSDASMLFTDASNRFPYPASNHWSIIDESPASSQGFPDTSGRSPEASRESKYLISFREQISFTHLIAPHLPLRRHHQINAYFDEFLTYCDDRIPLSVFEFARRINPEQIYLVHYSGMEDRNHYGEALLNPIQLENWTNAKAEISGLASSFHVPRPGNIYEII
jgi:hypothetical protein